MRVIHPSVSGDLNELGGQLADFLTRFAPAQPLPYLSDVARLEWLAHQAHYAADHAPLDVGALVAIKENEYPQLRLTLHPAVAVLNSAYPLFRIWEVHQDDYAREIAVDLASGGECVVVYRPQFRAAVARLAMGDAVFLTAVARGALLEAALADALNADPGFDLAARLRDWTLANIIVALRVAG